MKILIGLELHKPLQVLKPVIINCDYYLARSVWPYSYHIIVFKPYTRMLDLSLQSYIFLIISTFKFDYMGWSKRPAIGHIRSKTCHSTIAHTGQNYADW